MEVYADWKETVKIIVQDWKEIEEPSLARQSLYYLIAGVVLVFGYTGLYMWLS